MTFSIRIIHTIRPESPLFSYLVVACYGESSTLGPKLDLTGQQTNCALRFSLTLSEPEPHY